MQGGEKNKRYSEKKIDGLSAGQSYDGIPFCKEKRNPTKTIWSILKKEDYEVREKNIRKICKAMGISASEIMESEEEAKRNLRAGEIPVMHKYRKLDKSDQFRVQGYMDALLEKQDGEKSTS